MPGAIQWNSRKRGWKGNCFGHRDGHGRRWRHAGQDFELALDPSAIALWSPDSPALYRVTFRFVDGSGQKVDERSWKWGFKKLETRGTSFT